MDQLKERIRKQVETVKKKFLTSLPVICFFLFLFYTILFIFGTQYVMVATLITVLFQTNHRKLQPLKKMAGLVLTQLAVSVLAYGATLNLPLTIFLNLTIPFGFIFLKSSQFNQMGYFSGVMTFTFLQLMPLDLKGFFVQTAAMVYAGIIFIVAVKVYQWGHAVQPDYRKQQTGLGLLAQYLRLQLEGREEEINTAPLYQLQQSLYLEAYQKRGRKEIVTMEGKISYIFALIFQRAAYFLDIHYQPEMMKEEGVKEFVEKAAQYLEEAGRTPFWEADGREELKKRGMKLLDEAEKKELEIYISFQNLLRPFLLILDKFDEKEKGENTVVWSMPPHQKPLGKIIYQMKPDAFETRFALRMSAVLTLSFVFVSVSQADHSYWLPLNAFLLLRPMYEDSQYRMLTRFLGTAAGCMIFAAVFHLFPGMAGHMALASIMVVCMYTATPGTSLHGIFVTCFGLSMATLAMNTEVAVELRMIYVLAAVSLVVVINQFFFPTSMGHRFRYNFQMIFHMHHVYLKILERALYDRLDYGTICDAHMQYHLMHEQVREYLKKEEGDYYRKLLDTSWRMVSEMEQILFLVNSRRRGVEETETLENYIAHVDYVLEQIQDCLHLKKEKDRKKLKQMGYRRYIQGEKELSRLLTKYAKNVSLMYRLVLEKKA